MNTNMPLTKKSVIKALVGTAAIGTLLALAIPAPALADPGERGHKGRPEGHVKYTKPARFEQREENRGIHDRGREHRGKRDEHRHRKHDRDDRKHRDHDRHRDRYRHSDRRDWRDRHGYGHGHGHKHGHDKHFRPHHRPHYKPAYRPHKHRWRPDRYHYGYRWHRLPRHYVSLTIGGLGYYFSDGIFYRPHGPGYVVAQAPVGALVYNLPGSAISVSFGGMNYYVAYDTYYRWDRHHRGYRVVTNPGFY